jgi:hypothetical protein
VHREKKNAEYVKVSKAEAKCALVAVYVLIVHYHKVDCLIKSSRVPVVQNMHTRLRVRAHTQSSILQGI